MSSAVQLSQLQLAWSDSKKLAQAMQASLDTALTWLLRLELEICSVTLTLQSWP